MAVADLSSVVEAELARLRAENARLRNLLRMTPEQAAAPVPGQAAFFEAPPGMVHNRSPEAAKVAFFGALFAARTDVYATRWENPHASKHGWIPAVRGGWRKGVRHEDRGYLPLTAKVIESHLRGEVHLGLYPLLDGGRCWWLAADFDKEEAPFDALMYVKAARALQVPVALEVSRSGVGAHAWVFFTSPVPAETVRRLGAGLLREAMSLSKRSDLASYDRLFPSQDLLPLGGVGNLIAAPLFRPARDKGARVFLDLRNSAIRARHWSASALRSTSTSAGTRHHTARVRQRRRRPPAPSTPARHPHRRARLPNRIPRRPLRRDRPRHRPPGIRSHRPAHPQSSAGDLHWE